MSARLHTFKSPRTREDAMSNLHCRRWWWGCADSDPFATAETEQISLSRVPLCRITQSAVDAAERSLNYGRFCGEVAIKVIRLGSASVESLPNAILRETVAYVLLISFANIRPPLAIYCSFGDAVNKFSVKFSVIFLLILYNIIFYV